MLTVSLMIIDIITQGPCLPEELQWLWSYNEFESFQAKERSELDYLTYQVSAQW